MIPKTLIPLGSALLVATATALAQACPDEGPYARLPSYNTYSNGPTAVASLVTDAAAACGDAFRIDVADPEPVPWGAGFQVVQDDAPADVANRTYRVSFRYRADAPRTFNLILNSRRYDTFGSDDHNYAGPELSATAAYQDYSLTFSSVRTPADGADYRLYFLLAVGNSATALYIDDVRMEEVLTARVNYHVSPTGDDAAVGTAAAPWRTLNYAFTQLGPGDTLTLADGTYPEQVTLRNLRASAAQPTVLRAANRWQARLEGQTQYQTILQVEDCSHVLVEGLEVYHPGQSTNNDWVTGIQVFASDHVAVRDNYVHDCGCNGISGRSSDYVTVERNVTAHNAKTNPYNCSGISVYQPVAFDQAPGPHIVVRANVAFGNECTLPFDIPGTQFNFPYPTDGNGIILDDFNNGQRADNDPFKNVAYTQETIVENNLAFDNGGAGIRVFQVREATIRHNTTHHNQRVLEQHPSRNGEIGLAGIAGTVVLANNIAVQAPGRNADAVTFEDYGSTTEQLTSSTNVIVGDRLNSGNVVVSGDLVRAVSEQSFPAFENAAATPPAFSSVDDFRGLFGLAPSSPALDAATANESPATDLEGRARPVDGAPDIGAYEGAGAVLPVTLARFGARAIGPDAVLVTWSTAVETDARDFVVERRDGDAGEWTPVATVFARGVGDYEATDGGIRGASAKTLYYRLRQRDLDGTEALSAVAAVTFAGGEPGLLAGANVVAGSEALRLNAAEGAALSVLRADGAAVAQVRVRGGWAVLPTLPAGLYVLRAGDGRVARVVVR